MQYCNMQIRKVNSKDKYCIESDLISDSTNTRRENERKKKHLFWHTLSHYILFVLHFFIYYRKLLTRLGNWLFGMMFCLDFIKRGKFK